MAWQSAGCKQDHVDANIFPILRVFMRDAFHGACDSLEPIRIYGVIEVGLVPPPFNFDEGDQCAALGNQVNLSARSFYPPRKDTPAFRLHPQGGPRFSITAVLLGLLALHSARNSSALA